MRLKLTRIDYAGAAGFFAYSSSAAITPICLLKLAGDLSFSLAGGGGIEAVRALLILVVLVLSGFFAARWGKAAVLAAGSFILAAGMFVYSSAPVFAVVLVAMIPVGLGSGIVEALVNPLVQDQHPDDSGRYLNIVNAFWSIGIMSTVLIVGELLTRGVSWRILLAVYGGIAFASGVLFIVFSPRDRKRERTATISPFAHMKDILRRKRFWVFAAALFSGGAAEAAFTFWSASYIQLQYNALPRMGGIGTACFATGMIAGRILSGRFVRQEKLRALILASALTGIAASLFVFAAGSLAGFITLLFLAGLSAACFWPSIQSYAADCLPVDSTMLFILLSCMGIPGLGFASWLMGVIGNAAGIRVGFAIVPFFFLSLFLIILIDGAVHRRDGKLDRVPHP